MFYILVILLFLFIFIFGGKIKWLSNYRQVMLKNLVPALVIGILFFTGFMIGTLKISNLFGSIVMGSYIFSLSAMGLAFAKSVPGFEPLPVCASFVKKQNRTRHVLFLLLFSAVIAALMILISAFIAPACHMLFREPDKSAQAISALPTNNKFLAFPMLLAGAGIAEEAMYRLFIQSLCWRLFKNPWVAIILSALFFALYHLTPLDSMYRIYWQYPLSQVTTVFFGGLVLGFFYKKRGFETTVLGHTLCDYIGVLMVFK